MGTYMYFLWSFSRKYILAFNSPQCTLIHSGGINKYVCQRNNGMNGQWLGFFLVLGRNKQDKFFFSGTMKEKV